MPFATVTAQDAALDAVVASWAATAATWRLFTGIPDPGVNELPADGGYAVGAYTGSEWAAASGGAKAATVDLGTSTDAYGDVGSHWAICDASGDVIYWDELTVPLAVSAASTPVSFRPELFFRSEF